MRSSNLSKVSTVKCNEPRKAVTEIAKMIGGINTFVELNGRILNKPNPYTLKILGTGILSCPAYVKPLNYGAGK